MKKAWKMVATHVLGLGSEIKINQDFGNPETRTITAINSALTAEGRREATGVTLDDGSTISRGEIEFCLDASK